MNYTLKDIAEKLDLIFHIGDNTQIKNMLFQDENELYAFSGNRKGIPQFFKCVKELYPHVDRDKLSEDYSINAKLIWTNYYFVRDYHKRTKLYPNLKFRYEESDEPKMKKCSRLFRILDNLILPIDSLFWNTYLPPNHFSDNCSVWHTDEDVTTIPDDLPYVDKRFIVDRHNIFFDKYPFNIKDQVSKGTNEGYSMSLESLGIDIEELIIESIIESEKEKGNILSKPEIMGLKVMIRQQLFNKNK